MQREVVGFTAFSYATFTFTPPEDNYGGAVVRVKELGDADSLYRVVFSAKGDQVTGGRTSTLTPGRLYVFSFSALNIDGSKEGMGIVMNNSGAGYLGGGDSTAPGSWTHSLTGAAKFGELIWTWAKHPDADVSHYIIEIYTALAGGSLLKRDIVPHENNASFIPGYKYTRQTGSLTSNLIGAARIAPVDHSGNVGSFTPRVAATTGDILQDDIANNEITAKAFSNIALINPAPAVTQIISCSITKRASTRIRIEFSYNLLTEAAPSSSWYFTLRRDTTSLQTPFASTLVQLNRLCSGSGVYEDNNTSAGTFQYNILTNVGSSQAQYQNLTLRVVEYRR